MNSSKQSKRFHAIDGLRGIAALWVVAYHAHLGNHLAHLSNVLPNVVRQVVFEWGYLGVSIFFVISGFVITHSLRNAGAEVAFYRRFVLRRFLRLSPAYYCSIGLVLLASTLSATLRGYDYAVPTYPAKLLAHSLYLQKILGFGHFEKIYWTLCFEVQFYLMVCALVWFARVLQDRYGLTQAQNLIVTLVAIGSLLWPLGILETNLWPGLLFPMLYSFWMGIMAYIGWAGTGWERIRFYSFAGVVLVSAWLTTPRFAIVTVITGVLLLELGRSDQIYTQLNWRWLQFLGMISYSLYLTHHVILNLAFFVSYRYFGHSLGVEIASFMGILGLCIAIATIVYYLVEKPSIQFSQKIKSSRSSKSSESPVSLSK